MKRSGLAPLIIASAILALVGAGPVTATASWCEYVALPTVTRPGTVLLRDTFESGTLSKWRIVDNGDAWAGVSNSRDHTGRCAGRLTVTSSSSSRANVQKSLPYGANDAWATGWFRVDRQGSWGSNVPTFRMFNGSTRIADIHRQNGTGDLFLRTRTSSGSWRYVKLNKHMALYRWYRIDFYVKAAWSSSSISIAVDGQWLYRTTAATLPASRLTTVMIGAEHYRQVMDLSFDDIVITAP